MPTTTGTSDVQNGHGYSMPPQAAGTAKSVAEGRNSNASAQLDLRRLVTNERQRGRRRTSNDRTAAASSMAAFPNTAGEAAGAVLERRSRSVSVRCPVAVRSWVVGARKLCTLTLFCAASLLIYEHGKTSASRLCSTARQSLYPNHCYVKYHKPQAYKCNSSVRSCRDVLLV